MLEKDVTNNKKEWTEPKLEKGELVNEITSVPGSLYGGQDGSGCGILKKIITLEQC